MLPFFKEIKINVWWIYSNAGYNSAHFSFCTISHSSSPFIFMKVCCSISWGYITIVGIWFSYFSSLSPHSSSYKLQGVCGHCVETWHFMGSWTDWLFQWMAIWQNTAVGRHPIFTCRSTVLYCCQEKVLIKCVKEKNDTYPVSLFYLNLTLCQKLGLMCYVSKILFSGFTPAHYNLAIHLIFPHSHFPCRFKLSSVTWAFVSTICLSVYVIRVWIIWKTVYVSLLPKK